MADLLVERLKGFESALKDLRRDIRAERVPAIAKVGLRTRAEGLGSEWFSEVCPALASRLPEELIEKYSAQFRRLVRLSAPNNKRTSYLEVLGELTLRFRSELTIPIQTALHAPESVNQLEALLAKVADPTESAYLAEAVACAKGGLFRATTVLGWCAAIDQIHRAIERTGFDVFNAVSQKMAAQTQGRYKKFTKAQSVSSMSDLRTVFDSDVLWILEGMNLIDINQHTRLQSCFELRNQCAHPGAAPITEYNLLSFFSDLDLIVFRSTTLAP